MTVDENFCSKHDSWLTSTSSWLIGRMRLSTLSGDSRLTIEQTGLLLAGLPKYLVGRLQFSSSVGCSSHSLSTELHQHLRLDTKWLHWLRSSERINYLRLHASVCIFWLQFIWHVWIGVQLHSNCDQQPPVIWLFLLCLLRQSDFHTHGQQHETLFHHIWSDHVSACFQKTAENYSFHKICIIVGAFEAIWFKLVSRNLFIIIIIINTFVER